jgi:periplasmic copper chaperone A
LVRTLIVAGAALLAACAGHSRVSVAAVSVTDPYAAEPVSADVAAIYLTIRNDTDEPDTLVSAETPIAAMANLHRMVGTGGAPQMRAVSGVEIPAHGQLQLRPGGLHLMLMNLVTLPHAGDTVDLTLVLRHAGTIAVRVPVVSYLEVGERAAVGGGQEQR